MLREDVILLYIPLPYTESNLPARRSHVPECHFIHVYLFSTALPAYSSFNLNVGPPNKSEAVIQLTMNYAMVHGFLCNVVYST